jgi:4-hydroxymandelate oxidase
MSQSTDTSDQTPLLNLMDYETRAHTVLSDAAWAYYSSAANDELTYRENHAAYERLKLHPRMLRDVSTRSLRVEVLGQFLRAPVIVAPMAYNTLAHPDGEPGIARAAGQRGLLVTHSTLASFTMEEVAAAATGPLWYQLYAYREREVNLRLIQRAEQSGYKAVVVTVDTPMLGRRESEIRAGFHKRDTVRAVNLLSDDMRPLFDAPADVDLAQYLQTIPRANLTWYDIRWIRSATRLPVLLKGIMRADDAARALDYGVDGIIVSNHGGRQLDGVPATIEVLEDITRAVNGRMPVIADGGIRRGTDIVKALALGARAVMVGRPLLWGLAVKGEAGAGHVLDLLLAELELAMALCGAASISEITADLIWRPGTR